MQLPLQYINNRICIFFNTSSKRLYYRGVKFSVSPVVLAPLHSSGLALGRVVSTAEVWELVEHPILSCAHRGLDGEVQSEEVRLKPH